MITSMGIYGFLSAAYQETANASSMVDKEIALIDNRIETFEKQKDLKSESLVGVEERIAQLNEGINNIEKDTQNLLLISVDQPRPKWFLKKIIDFPIYNKSIISAPIDKNKKPNLTALKKASISVGKALKIRSQKYSKSTIPVVIFESTVFPGATEEIFIPLITKKILPSVL